MKRFGLNPDKHKAIRKELLFANVIDHEMIESIGKKKNYKPGKQHMLSGRIVRAYKFISKLSLALGVSRKLLNKYEDNKLKEGAAKRNLVKAKVKAFLLRKYNCTILAGKRKQKYIKKTRIKKKENKQTKQNQGFVFAIIIW